MSRDELIIGLLPKVRRVAKAEYGKRRLPILDFDDIMAEGTLGLIQAVDNYRPEMGVRLATYADRRITGAIQDAFREFSFGHYGRYHKRLVSEMLSLDAPELRTIAAAEN